MTSGSMASGATTKMSVKAAFMAMERFGGACRLYAPMYRQVTDAALQKMLAGQPTASNREMAYADVKAAWEHYLANDNGGRGVVTVRFIQHLRFRTSQITNRFLRQNLQSRHS